MAAMKDQCERFLKAKRALFDKLYNHMNERQREAVYTINGPLLVLAGAGTGKTTVLVNRIAHLLKYGNAYYSERVPDTLREGDVTALEKAVELSPDEISQILPEFAEGTCPPWAVLSITFTNKAANEMKARLSKAVGEEMAEQIWAGTFHSICVRILRKYGERIGYAPGFTIYDMDDTKKVIGESLKHLNIDEKQLPIKTVMNAISRAKDQLKDPDTFEKEAGNDFRRSQIAVVYQLYQKKLVDSNAVDFDDIIMQTVRLLMEQDDVREYYQNRFHYVCVDEYQDTNHAQFMLTTILAGRYHNLMVVGDDDQSIYKFRGATIENILHFDETYQNAKVVKLEENYRSTSTILDAANAVIRNNFGRRGKELWSAQGQGEKITVRRLDNANEEARYIVDKIMEMKIREKRAYSDFAVLYRTNAQSQGLETVFAKSGIPYRILGGLRFYERKEIKDILSYLCVVNNPSDNLRLRRIINEPKRKIGDATVNALQSIADFEGVSIFDAMRNAAKYPAIAKSNVKLQDFVLLIDRLVQLSKTEKLSTLFQETLKLSGYRQMLIAGGEAEEDRLHNVEELVSNAVAYETENPEATLSDFLEEISLVADIDNYDATADAVVFMTIHSAKGLEFPVVFLPGMEENLFPSEQCQLNPEELEEERRLAYVAITRAKEKLFAIHVRERLQYGRTLFNPKSRFLTEIGDDNINYEMPKHFQPEPEAPAPNPTYSASRTRQIPKISDEFLKESDLTSRVGRTTGYDRFEAGDRVRHMTFGEGTIMSVKEMGADILYEIAFDQVGTKKLMATYAKLKRI